MFNNDLNIMQGSQAVIPRGRKRGRMGAGRRKALATANASVLLSEPQAIASWAQRCQILEIGFGMGDNLIASAQRHPQAKVLGVDVYLPGIAKALMGIEAAGLSNIAIINTAVGELLANTNMQLEQVHIYFPDPWPKRRNHNRRLVNREFIDKLSHHCRAQAHLHLATDSANYAQSMLELLQTHRLWRNYHPPAFSPRSLSPRTASKFESRALSAGRPIFDLIYQRV